MKYLLVLLVFVCGCSYDKNQVVGNAEQGDYEIQRCGAVTPIRVRTIEIDGCEYLLVQNGSIAHKGNCKHCQAERVKNGNP